jgi:hypothetical protein
VFHVKPNAECRTSHAADVLRVYVPDPTTLDPLAPPKPMAAGVAFGRRLIPAGMLQPSVAPLPTSPR